MLVETNKKNKQVIFNLKNSKYHSSYFIYICVGILFILGLIALIFSTPYKNDFKLSQFFEKITNYELGKWWARGTELIGDTQVLIYYLALFMIAIECFFAYKKQNKNVFFIKHYYLVKIIYILILFTIISIAIFRIYKVYNFDNGFGKYGDLVFQDTIIYRQVLTTLILVYQVIILSLFFYTIHFKLAKRSDILTNKYFSKSIKILIIGPFLLTVVTLIKGMASRPYYWNVIFADLLNKMSKTHPEFVTYYLKQENFQLGFLASSLDFKQYDFLKLVDINQIKNMYFSNANSTDNWAWYVFNGFFNPSKYTCQFTYYQEWAFPSGHACQTMVVGYAWYSIFITDKKLTTKKLMFCFVYLLFLVSMSFALVATRGHWVSDVAFSYVFAIPLIVIVEIIYKKLSIKYFRI
ncbi:phosphatase PAP2 family protein [Mycoplasma mycoides]|uniref:phosphatase PAP2 family protein n=1 Tax=Mycoplasma mycoides TaxID=2102 RepID=UPI002240D4F6|nr:phosphatase PAP2 family protein [Mycoplasma mycoides]QVK05199.1 phosphatase PAP2 family protein [Mycoplasma mycoides subsp. capri]